MIIQHMDELFLLPRVPVAMPCAYWLDPKQLYLSSHIMLVQPGHDTFALIQREVDAAGPGDYDMEIINRLFGHSALVLPHRRYALLSGEFRQDSHESYLGNLGETWDPVAVFNEAKLIHFSDFPLPKPWLFADPGLQRPHEPPCVNEQGVENCAARDLWNELYADYRDKRNVSLTWRFDVLD